jgi:hypothetical protein
MIAKKSPMLLCEWLSSLVPYCRHAPACVSMV